MGESLCVIEFCMEAKGPPMGFSKRKYSFISFITTGLQQFLIETKNLNCSVNIYIIAVAVHKAAPFLPHFNWSSGKYVIILAANEGGGVMQWKGAKEWSVERSSIANKKAYAERHGYHLAIKDVSAKKRYAHEWRESWEKVNIIKQTMRQFPNAEWFWWLDLHT